MPSLARIRQLSPQEVSWRLSTLGRTTGDRARSALRPPRWERDRLRTILAGHIPRRAAMADSDPAWLDVHRELLATIRARPSRFVIDPVRLPEVRDAVLARWPDAAGDAAARAGRIAVGQYDILGYQGVSFLDADGRLDWHADPVHGRRAPLRFWSRVPYLDPSIGDHKIIWELNRHQHWLALGRALWLTGDPRWGDLIVAQLTDWMRANPPLLGVNWASMLELAFRSLSWLSALHLLLRRDDVAPDRPWLVDLLVGVDRQLRHVERNLSHYFSPNTHLTGEALALYVAGSALPELDASTRWMDMGRAILLREIDRQIAPDGGHVERATHYHRYTLDFYVLAALVARANGDSEAAALFGDAVGRLTHFMRAMADDAGRIPHIGDDDGGVLWPICGTPDDDVRASLTLGAAVSGRHDLAPCPAPEDALWIGLSHLPVLASPLPQGAEPRSELFADTGFAIVRDDAGHHLVFDVGPHGYLNGGHAHADALAVTLSVRGVPFLIDPGTATYTVDPRLRDQLRSTASHNTVTIDGRPSSEPAGPFQWRTRADAALNAWRANGGFSWAEAAHEGYRPVRHRRSVVAARGSWVIVDEILAEGTHRADCHWHVHPEWLVHGEDGQRLLATRADGSSLWMLHDGGHVWLTYGDAESGLGWSSPHYGALEPVWTARISRTAPAPFSMVTWIGDTATTGAGGQLPTLDVVPIEHDRASGGLGVRVRDGARVTFTALRAGDAAARDGRHTGIGAYASDARLLQYATSGTCLVWLALADATFATAGGAALSVTADARLADLAIAFDGDRLCVDASTPAALTLVGPAVARARHVLLNGREWTPSSGAGGNLTIPASAWGDATPARQQPLAVGA